VFLYCEEPILAARAKAQGGRLMVFPELQALHAHVASAKGNSSRRMLHFIRSRLYYLDTYAGYGRMARCALHASYGLLRALHSFKARVRPA
jgi:GT2 family glycosyltransferase